MKINSRKNLKLIKQYPFVSDILSTEMEPHGELREGIQTTSGFKTMVDDLTIRVEKADGDLMMRYGCNIGFNDGTFALQRGKAMRYGEYVFAIDKHNQIINRLNFPLTTKERREATKRIYAKQVLWESKDFNVNNTSNTHSNCLWNKTKYIIWVTVKTCHDHTKDERRPFGAFQNRSINITIYSEPDQGFEKIYRESNVWLNLYLCDWIEIPFAEDKDIIIISGMLQELCNTFQEEVYFNGMRDRIKSEIISNPFDKFNTVEVFSNESCGVEQIRLADNNSYITFNLSSRAKQLYVAGQEGTLPQIRNLVRTVVRSWNNNPESRILHNNQTT